MVMQASIVCLSDAYEVAEIRDQEDDNSDGDEEGEREEEGEENEGVDTEDGEDTEDGVDTEDGKDTEGGEDTYERKTVHLLKRRRLMPVALTKPAVDAVGQSMLYEKDGLNLRLEMAICDSERDGEHFGLLCGRASIDS